VNDVVVAETQAPAASGWEAELALHYGRRGQQTLLERREHRGPLVVQKPLYPEGEAVCQTIVVHPPAGIAGGDRLVLKVGVGDCAHAQMTTPGAAKWYRSSGATASQKLVFSVANDAVLEWLPRESIFYDGALATLETEIALTGNAVLLAWDIACLGRRLSGERWSRGRLRQRLTLCRDAARQWSERAIVDGDGDLLHAAVGLKGHAVFGTFLASASEVPDDLLRASRAIGCDDGEVAVTRLPGVLVARYLGDSPETAHACFSALWALARQALAHRNAVPPRIWST
jgi:urease accessory protein